MLSLSPTEQSHKNPLPTKPCLHPCFFCFHAVIVFLLLELCQRILFMICLFCFIFLFAKSIKFFESLESFFQFYFFLFNKNISDFTRKEIEKLLKFLADATLQSRKLNKASTENNYILTSSTDSSKHRIVWNFFYCFRLRVATMSRRNAKKINENILIQRYSGRTTISNYHLSIEKNGSEKHLHFHHHEEGKTRTKINALAESSKIHVFCYWNSTRTFFFAFSSL